jgi:hypothetical protein
MTSLVGVDRMIGKVLTCTVVWLDVVLVEVEADNGVGLPAFTKAETLARV